MKLITPQLLERFNQIGRQNAASGDAIVVCRYYAPWNADSWYVLEYNPTTQKFFGLVDSSKSTQFDYFSLDTLLDSTGPEDQKVTRDISWEEKRLGDFLNWIFDHHRH